MISQIIENLEYGDLARVLHNELHIDEYKSKMGEDADICVISFKLLGKDAAADLVSFIEKGYDWILDADLSSGEQEAGRYLVFVEIPRSSKLPDQIYQLLSDFTNLTEFAIDTWQMQYHTSSNKYPVTLETLNELIPLSAETYRKKFVNDIDDARKIDQLKHSAGLDIDTKAPVNEFTERLRIAAGIR